jgi:hypothetical protein
VTCPLSDANPAHVCTDRDGDVVTGAKDCWPAARREAVRAYDQDRADAELGLLDAALYERGVVA